MLPALVERRRVSGAAPEKPRKPSRGGDTDGAAACPDKKPAQAPRHHQPPAEKGERQLPVIPNGGQAAPKAAPAASSAGTCQQTRGAPKQPHNPAKPRQDHPPAHEAAAAPTALKQPANPAKPLPDNLIAHEAAAPSASAGARQSRDTLKQPPNPAKPQEAAAAPTALKQPANPAKPLPDNEATAPSASAGARQTRDTLKHPPNPAKPLPDNNPITHEAAAPSASAGARQQQQQPPPPLLERRAPPPPRKHCAEPPAAPSAGGPGDPSPRASGSRGTRASMSLRTSESNGLDHLSELQRAERKLKRHEDRLHRRQVAVKERERLQFLDSGKEEEGLPAGLGMRSLREAELRANLDLRAVDAECRLAREKDATEAGTTTKTKKKEEEEEEELPNLAKVEGGNPPPSKPGCVAGERPPAAECDRLSSGRKDVVAQAGVARSHGDAGRASVGAGNDGGGRRGPHGGNDAAASSGAECKLGGTHDERTPGIECDRQRSARKDAVAQDGVARSHGDAGRGGSGTQQGPADTATAAREGVAQRGHGGRKTHAAPPPEGSGPEGSPAAAAPGRDAPRRKTGGAPQESAGLEGEPAAGVGSKQPATPGRGPAEAEAGGGSSGTGARLWKREGSSSAREVEALEARYAQLASGAGRNGRIHARAEQARLADRHAARKAPAVPGRPPSLAELVSLYHIARVLPLHQPSPATADAVSDSAVTLSSPVFHPWAFLLRSLPASDWPAAVSAELARADGRARIPAASAGQPADDPPQGLQQLAALHQRRVPAAAAVPLGAGAVVLFESAEHFGALSSEWVAPVVVRGKEWRSVAHFYHAMAFSGTPAEEAIRASRLSGAEAAAGVDGITRGDWAAVRHAVMAEGQRAKFEQHPALARYLLATRPASLRCRHAWDAHWGVVPCGQGANHLGEMLMSLRDALGRSGGADA
ncbi:N-glycosidase YbiA [Diplonema papillatum]|nr:N-glycosidase YbiA [Diplonema papillatum]